ncbi:hypothetical protein QQP08_027490 [Theobroma cacao]|nr:hypothetical protein QQP08_027490 [Theobroma cacao]
MYGLSNLEFLHSYCFACLVKLLDLEDYPRMLHDVASLPNMGVERGIRLEGLTEPQILKALEDLVKAGASLKA